MLLCCVPGCKLNKYIDDMERGVFLIPTIHVRMIFCHTYAVFESINNHLLEITLFMINKSKIIA